MCQVLVCMVQHPEIHTDYMSASGTAVCWQKWDQTSGLLMHGGSGDLVAVIRVCYIALTRSLCAWVPIHSKISSRKLHLITLDLVCNDLICLYVGRCVMSLASFRHAHIALSLNSLRGVVNKQWSFHLCQMGIFIHLGLQIVCA